MKLAVTFINNGYFLLPNRICEDVSGWEIRDNLLLVETNGGKEQVVIPVSNILCITINKGGIDEHLETKTV